MLVGQHASLGDGDTCQKFVQPSVNSAVDVWPWSHVVDFDFALSTDP